MFLVPPSSGASEETKETETSDDKGD